MTAGMVVKYNLQLSEKGFHWGLKRYRVGGTKRRLVSSGPSAERTGAVLRFSVSTLQALIEFP